MQAGLGESSLLLFPVLSSVLARFAFIARFLVSSHFVPARSAGYRRSGSLARRLARIVLRTSGVAALR